jgi:hypothetical protein
MNKQFFLIKLIEEIPENSYWAIQGLYDTESKDMFRDFFVSNCECVDFRYDHCIKLTKDIRSEIIKLISNEDISHDIVHHCISFENKIHFASYDYCEVNLFFVDFMSDSFKEYCIENETTEFRW